MDAQVRIKQLKVRGYKDPWANLAAAIIHGGVAANDDLFLKSKWCETLTDLVSLASEMEDSRLSPGRGIHAAVEQRGKQASSIPGGRGE